MRFLTRKGFLIEEQGMTYLADTDPDTVGPLRAAACTYRSHRTSPRDRQDPHLGLPARAPPRSPARSRETRCHEPDGGPSRGRLTWADHALVADRPPAERALVLSLKR
jgi:hypothetical protein